MRAATATGPALEPELGQKEGHSCSADPALRDTGGARDHSARPLSCPLGSRSYGRARKVLEVEGFSGSFDGVRSSAERRATSPTPKLHLQRPELDKAMSRQSGVFLQERLSTRMWYPVVLWPCVCLGLPHPAWSVPSVGAELCLTLGRWHGPQCRPRCSTQQGHRERVLCAWCRPPHVPNKPQAIRGQPRLTRHRWPSSYGTSEAKMRFQLSQGRGRTGAHTSCRDTSCSRGSAGRALGGWSALQVIWLGGENLTPPTSHRSWFCLEVWVAMGTHAVSGWSRRSSGAGGGGSPGLLSRRFPDGEQHHCPVPQAPAIPTVSGRFQNAILTPIEGLDPIR